MNETLAWGHYLDRADGVAWGVMGLLILASVSSWYCIGVKFWRWWRTQRAPHRDAARDLQTPRHLPEPYATFQHRGLLAWRSAQGLLGQPGTIRTGVGASLAETPAALTKAPATPATLATRIARALRRAMDDYQWQLEAGQTLLATVASSAPFVGLLGTVWGIHHALRAMGQGATVGLEQVAGPVGEALIMTGLGLAVALPAAIAYNAFSHAAYRTRQQLHRYASDLQEALLELDPLSCAQPFPVAFSAAPIPSAEPSRPGEVLPFSNPD